MKKFLVSITALIIITSLVACTKPTSETSVETPESNTTVASEATSEALVSVTNEKDTSSTKSESHTTEKSNATNINKSTTETSVVTSKEVTTNPNNIPKVTTKPTTTKPETTKVVPTLPSYTPEEEMIELFNAINNYRSENGLNKLSLDPQLCKLAYIRAQEQELMEGHTRPNSKKFSSVFREYNFPPHDFVGENIALIWKSPSTRPLELWKTSETHNKNMLDEDWVKIGIAVYINPDGRYNIVQLFAS